MGLLKLAGKAVAGGAKLAGVGLKKVGTEIAKGATKEAKSLGKEIVKGTKNKTQGFFEKKIEELTSNSLSSVTTNDDDYSIEDCDKEVKKVETQAKKSSSVSYEEQIHVLKELNELLKEGIINQREFDMKKKEILGV